MIHQPKHNLLENLQSRGLIKPPSWLPGATKYATIMGSVAYGVSGDTSDFDVYGFAIPRKEIVFPHLAGYIPGFGTKPPSFDQYQQVHVYDATAEGGHGRNYDLAIYSIVKYFDLCLECNPNMIDSLFTAHRCVLINSPIAQHVRDNRKLFLSKRAWPKFKGYAYSQINKMRNKNAEGNRADLIEKFGYDIKFAYHLVRLLNECEQILMEGDLDLERSREQLKAIRRGEWTQKQVEEYFTDKEKYLEGLYVKSDLRPKPDEESIKKVLTECLEMEYSSLSGCVENPSAEKQALENIRQILDRYKS